MLDLKYAIITIDTIRTQKNMYVEIKEYFNFALNNKDKLSKILKYENMKLNLLDTEELKQESIMY